MSTKYRSSKDVPTSVLLEHAEQLADAVTKGESGYHEFTMRIPAECDRDADLVLCELVKRFKLMNQEQTELAARVGRLRGEIEHLANYGIPRPLTEDHLFHRKSVDEERQRLLEIANSTPQQNLNALKREVSIDAFIAGFNHFDKCHRLGERFGNEDIAANEYAKTKYPIGKDGE